MRYVPEQVQGNLYRGPRPENLLDLPIGCRYSFDLEENPCKLDISFTQEVSFPLSDLFCPSREQLEECLQRLRSIVPWGVTLLHCREGVDRTGFVVAYWRVKVQGWSLVAASEEMLEKGFHRYRYEHWLTRMPELFA